MIEKGKRKGLCAVKGVGTGDERVLRISLM